MVREKADATPLGLMDWERLYQQEREQRTNIEAALAASEAARQEGEALYQSAKETVEELRAAIAAKDEFFSVVSHELRTPTTTIYGGLRLLATRRDQLPPETVDELIDTASEEAGQLVRLIENLLTLARLQSGQEIDPDVLSTAVIITEAVQLFRQTKPAREVHCQFGDGLAPVMGSAAYLRLVVQNLLASADKYSPSERPIEIHGARDGDEIEIAVRDHGPGAPVADSDSIFDSFNRPDKRTILPAGQALGYTVCKRLIDALGGRIWAKNRPTGGLEIGFALPIASDAAGD